MKHSSLLLLAILLLGKPTNDGQNHRKNLLTAWTTAIGKLSVLEVHSISSATQVVELQQSLVTQRAVQVGAGLSWGNFQARSPVSAQIIRENELLGIFHHSVYLVVTDFSHHVELHDVVTHVCHCHNTVQ